MPDDVARPMAALLTARAETARINAEAAAALAQQSNDQALIAHFKLRIEKLNRDRFGRPPSAPPGCSTRWNYNSRS